jgi:hypothetical protein
MRKHVGKVVRSPYSPPKEKDGQWLSFSFNIIEGLTLDMRGKAQTKNVR